MESNDTYFDVVRNLGPGEYESKNGSVLRIEKIDREMYLVWYYPPVRLFSCNIGPYHTIPSVVIRKDGSIIDMECWRGGTSSRPSSPEESSEMLSKILFTLQSISEEETIAEITKFHDLNHVSPGMVITAFVILIIIIAFGIFK